MILGYGDIAKAINDRDGFVFLAKGASNRVALTGREKEREWSGIFKLGQQQRNRKEMVVYISSLSVYYSRSEYAIHKRCMEAVVRRYFRNHCILRIGNINWGDNPNTLINFLRSKIEAKEQYTIEDTHRYLCSKEELNHWIGMIPTTGQHEMNVTGLRLSVAEIVRMIKEENL